MGFIRQIVSHAATSAMRQMRPAAPVQVLSVPSIVDRFMRVRPNPGEIWFDHGTGNGQTLANQARKFLDTQFIGINFESRNMPELALWMKQKAPPNLSYGLLYDNPLPEGHPFVAMRMFPDGMQKHDTFDDEVARLIRRQWGQRFAGVVSLFYPHAVKTGPGMLFLAVLPLAVPELIRNPKLRREKFGDRFFMNLDLALDSLRDGGKGILLIDNEHDTGRAIRYLKKQARVKKIEVSETPLGPGELSRMGVEPYRTTSFHSLKGPEEVVLDRAYLVIFET